MKSFELPLPPTHFTAKEVAAIIDETYMTGAHRLADVRQWVREQVIAPAGVIGRPSRTAAHVYSASQVFLLTILLALGDVGIGERAVLGEVVATFERDLDHGETLLQHVWTSARGILRQEWLMRVDVVRPEPGVREIEVHVYTTDTPDAFRPQIPSGKYSGSVFVDLSHVAENVEAGIEKVLADTGEGD